MMWREIEVKKKDARKIYSKVRTVNVVVKDVWKRKWRWRRWWKRGKEEDEKARMIVSQVARVDIIIMSLTAHRIILPPFVYIFIYLYLMTRG